MIESSFHIKTQCKPSISSSSHLLPFSHIPGHYLLCQKIKNKSWSLTIIKNYNSLKEQAKYKATANTDHRSAHVLVECVNLSFKKRGGKKKTQNTQLPPPKKKQNTNKKQYFALLSTTFRRAQATLKIKKFLIPPKLP